MIVLIKELVNTLFSTSTKAFSINIMAQTLSYIDINIDIDIDILRGRFASSSHTSSKESSTYLATSLQPYHKRIEIFLLYATVNN